MISSQKNFNRRVVVTGMGVVSPIGNTIFSFRQNLMNGISGQNQIHSFDVSRFPVQTAFEIKDFDGHKHGTHLLDPFIQYAVDATHQAFEDSNLKLDRIDPYRVGISVSSSKGGMHTLDRFKERFFKNPSAILGARIYSNTVPNFAAQWIARKWKLHGPAKCYVAACATGTVSVIEGARMVADGTTDYCVAGAADASIVPVLLAGYKNMRALSPDVMRPFDKNRKGFLVGEGAGIVILETLENAQARGAVIYGEIADFSYGNDPYDALHFDPEGETLSHTILQTLKKAKLKPQDIQYINLHGTATKAGDLYETKQLKKAFGEKIYQISTSATKSMTGHMLGATGAVEIIACLLAMRESRIPPTIHLKDSDPECDLDYTVDKARAKEVKNALSVSMGFGGHAACILLKKI